MAIWLYDSKGQPCAYAQGEQIRLPLRGFVGELHSDGTVMYNELYVGEVVEIDGALRFLFDTSKSENRWRSGAPLQQVDSEQPKEIPPPVSPCELPDGFRDVEVHGDG